MERSGDDFTALQTVKVGPLTKAANDVGADVPDVMLALKSSEQTLALRQRYGLSMLRLVIGQVAVLNLYFLAMGLKWLTIDPDVFKVFAVSVFAEVVALALVVTRRTHRQLPHARERRVVSDALATGPCGTACSVVIGRPRENAPFACRA